MTDSRPVSQADEARSRLRLALELMQELPELNLDVGKALTCVAAAEELEISSQTAARMHHLGLLGYVRARSRDPEVVRLEPAHLDLPGWPVGPNYSHPIFKDWLRNPVGPFYLAGEGVAVLLSAAQPGSPADLALTALLWEGQGD